MSKKRGLGRGLGALIPGDAGDDGDVPNGPVPAAAGLGDEGASDGRRLRRPLPFGFLNFLAYARFRSAFSFLRLRRLPMNFPN